MGVIKERQCLAVAAVLVCLSGILWFQLYQYPLTGGIGAAATVCGAVLCLLLTVVALDIAHLNPADSHTVRTLLTQYLFNTSMAICGVIAWRGFQQLSKKVAKTQEQILLSNIIRPNENTEFGRKHNFKDILCREDYRRKVPLTTYDYYIPDIQRIETQHECLQGVLSHSPVVYLAVTSGSTGRNKVIPIGKDFRSKGFILSSLMFDAVGWKAGRSMLRTFKLGYRPLVTVSSTGLKKAPISYHMQRNPGFNLIPDEVYDITDEETALYVEAVLSLAEKEVGNIQGFMSTLVWAFWRLIEQNWKQMCDDIEHGTISRNVRIEPHIRVVIEHQMQDANRAARAKELRTQFDIGRVGIARRVWPGLHHVVMLTSGCFASYARTLRDIYMRDVRQCSLLHAASESFVGVVTSNNIMSEIPHRYSLCAPLVYLEFLAVEVADETTMVDEQAAVQHKVFYPEELRIGKCYEVVITNEMGLYRYRLGDVIKVVDFYNQCPIYEFQYRTGHVLNVFWEKTPENVVYDAIQTSCTKLRLVLIDYTTTEDVVLLSVPEYETNSDCKHYVMFIEATLGDGTPASLTVDDKSLIDQNLCSQMELYNTLRNKNSIGPMHVIEVKPGTFSKLRARMLGTHNNPQLKMPRVIRDTVFLSELLMSCYEKHVS